jgi:cell division protein FtsL
MMDWAGSIVSRNYGIRRQTDRRNLAELLKIISSIALLAAVFGFYAWVRCGIVNLGYLEQELRTQEESQLKMERNLILKEETLKNPERIDNIAQNELGMIRVRTNQLISPAFQDSELGDPTALAMAAAPPVSPEPRKSSPTN